MSESFKAAHDYPDISERFDSDGYYLPVDVLSADEADMEIDENKAVLAQLAPGQMSLHHGKLLHASGCNHSGERRIGLAFENTFGPEPGRVR